MFGSFAVDSISAQALPTNGSTGLKTSVRKV
jgi:hypothetical protein